MPSVYCQCGYKNNYSSTKPKTCESCGEPLERKAAPKHHQTRRAHYEEPEIEEEFDEPKFDEQAIRGSIVLHKEEGEDKFMTVEQLRKSQASFSRGNISTEEQNMRNQVIGEMLGTVKPSSPSFTPPDDNSSGPRRVSRLTK